MKRKSIVWLLVATLLVGCNSAKESEKKQDIVRSLETQEEMKGIDTEKLEDVLHTIEHVSSINYVGNDQVLIVADKMYLIDVSNGTLLAKNEIDESFLGKIKVYNIDGKGFAILSIKNKDKEATVKKEKTFSMTIGGDMYISVRYYDETLQCTKEINVSDEWEINTMSIENVAMDRKGNLAIYDEDAGCLYYCNSVTKEKRKVLKAVRNRLIYDKKLEFCISNGLEFTEDDAKLLFGVTCMGLSSGESSMDGYGSVDVNGENLFVEQIGEEYSVMYYRDGKVVFSQSCGFTIPTGEIYVYDAADNSRKSMKLTSGEESDNVDLSDQGKIMATSCVEGKNSWKLSFYNVETGELIQSKVYDKWNTEQYINPRIFVFEELNLAILFIRTTEENCKDVLEVLYL